MIQDSFLEAVRKSSSLLVPTSTPSVSPLPSVIPGTPIYYEDVGETGTKTLWVRPPEICNASTLLTMAGRLRPHVPFQRSIHCYGMERASLQETFPRPHSLHHHLCYPLLLRHGNW